MIIGLTSSRLGVDDLAYHTLRRLFPLLVILCTACMAVPAQVVYVTPSAGDVLPVEAGRIVDAATATAAAVATQVAQATATDQSARATSTAVRAATLDALSDRQAMATLAAAQTQDVVSATASAATAQAAATSSAAGTQDARRVAFAATAGAATSTAQLAAALATETVNRARQQTEVDAASGAAGALLKLVLALALAFGLWFLVRWLAGVVNADLTRRKNAAALRDTPLGPVLLIAGPTGMLTARLLSAPAAPPDPELEPEPEAIDPANLIYGQVDGKPRKPLVAEWRIPDLDAERAEIADLVRAAIAVEGEGGTRIPRYSRLPGWQTNAEGWKARTDTLMRAGHVTKASGAAGGTFLTKGRTLYQLLAGLLNGTLPLSPVDVVAGEAANVSQNIS